MTLVDTQLAADERLEAHASSESSVSLAQRHSFTCEDPPPTDDDRAGLPRQS